MSISQLFKDKMHTNTCTCTQTHTHTKPCFSECGIIKLLLFYEGTELGTPSRLWKRIDITNSPCREENETFSHLVFFISDVIPGVPPFETINWDRPAGKLSFECCLCWESSAFHINRKTPGIPNGKINWWVEEMSFEFWTKNSVSKISSRQNSVQRQTDLRTVGGHNKSVFDYRL